MHSLPKKIPKVSQSFFVYLCFGLIDQNCIKLLRKVVINIWKAATDKKDKIRFDVPNPIFMKKILKLCWNKIKYIKFLSVLSDGLRYFQFSDAIRAGIVDSVQQFLQEEGPDCLNFRFSFDICLRKRASEVPQLSNEAKNHANLVIVWDILVCIFFI